MYGVLKLCLFALVCIQIELQRTLNFVFIFFRNLNFQITGAAYTQNFTVYRNWSIVTLQINYHMI